MKCLSLTIFLRAPSNVVFCLGLLKRTPPLIFTTPILTRVRVGTHSSLLAHEQLLLRPGFSERMAAGQSGAEGGCPLRLRASCALDRPPSTLFNMEGCSLRRSRGAHTFHFALDIFTATAVPPAVRDTP